MAVYYFKIQGSHNIDGELERKKSLLEDIFKALSKVVEFLSTDFEEINMDGLYGYRICQGSLIGALQDCSRGSYNCPDELIIKLRLVIERLHELGDKALPYVKQQDEEYYNNYISILTVPFTVEYTPETLGQNIQPMSLAKVSYDGHLGDKCFGGIMGTLIDGGRKSPPCTIVDGCWELMSVKGTLGYFTTHQLLYTLYGEHSGCSQKLEDLVRNHLGMSLREWQRYLCEQIYLDSTLREYNRQVDVQAEDLFLEQIALCGILGFQNFFNETWIQMVLTWQNPRGCFTVPVSAMEVFVELSKNYEELHALAERLFGDDNSVNKARGAKTGRSLMTEAVMSDDCLSHKTGLGAAVLGTHARYLVSELFGKN
ncbi:unnamed protein product [Candidula unifasciata]|uniref:Uncharacterized protein n=1 Tax=Candidula unifasciata TaxID=100452 RepID=A0A8S3Z9F7_9EUPU|nr:unnamed protein product [Candidula unifasciata]